MKLFKFFTFFLFIIVLQSCVSIALKSIGANKSSAELKLLTSGEKKVYFIPMHHVGKKAFYDDVYSITDSLGKLGYISFYEGLDTKVTDSIELDILKKKWRKTLGYYLDKKGYIDTTNHLLMGKYKISKKYINQPESTILISSNTNPKNVDVTIEGFISAFEEETGEVKLDSCDIKTPLEQNYALCRSLKDIDKKRYELFSDNYILTYRNKHLASAIENETKNKIVVVYGSFHFDGLLEELKKINSSWEKEYVN